MPPPLYPLSFCEYRTRHSHSPSTTYLWYIDCLTVHFAFQCNATHHQCSKDAFSNSESIREKMEISVGCIIYTRRSSFFMLWSAFCPYYVYRHDNGPYSTSMWYWIHGWEDLLQLSFCCSVIFMPVIILVPPFWLTSTAFKSQSRFGFIPQVLSSLFFVLLSLWYKSTWSTFTFFFSFQRYSKYKPQKSVFTNYCRYQSGTVI